jgi:dTMP kinase
VPLGARSEALLFAAARAQLVHDVIGPALERGLVVVSDRFVDSSLAYQGAGRGLGVEDVARLNSWACGGLVPDLTFLLELSPGQAAGRSGESDRFEEEGFALQARVADAYAALADAEPGRWRRVDASRAPEEVHAEVLGIVEAARTGAPA